MSRRAASYDEDVSRIRLPAFIHEVIEDQRQRGILVAGMVALFAVGLTPRVLSPTLPNVQEQLRLESEIQNLSLVLAFASTAMVIAGGLVSDIFRRRSLLIGGLMVMLAGSMVSIAFDDGQVFYAANLASVAASGVVLAYGIGGVAVAYAGVPRATALGIVYAAYGAGAAVSPVLLTLFPRRVPSVDATLPAGFTFDTSLAYLVTALTAALALWAAVRWMPGIPGSLPVSHKLIASVAVWSISILAINTGILGLGGPGAKLAPMALIIGGVAVMIVSTLSFGRDDHDQSVRDREASTPRGPGPRRMPWSQPTQPSEHGSHEPRARHTKPTWQGPLARYRSARYPEIRSAWPGLSSIHGRCPEPARTSSSADGIRSTQARTISTVAKGSLSPTSQSEGLSIRPSASGSKSPGLKPRHDAPRWMSATSLAMVLVSFIIDRPQSRSGPSGQPLSTNLA